MGKNSLFLWLIAGLLASCAGLKRQDRPQYDLMDNLTSRYNIVFHARELIAEAEAQNVQAYRPHYQDYLSIFIEPNEASVQSHARLMDSVLTKTRRVIHDKDKGKYVDDAYFLTARANYVAGNYYNAAEYFSYVANAFPEGTRLRQQARIWQVRSLIQLDAVSEAMPVLDSVFSHLADHRGSRGMAFATKAQYHLSRGEIAEAVAYLRSAIKQRGSRTDKLRWHYLLGQLLEDQQLYDEAAAHYKKVARSNVSYEMAFHAALRQTYVQAIDSEESMLVIRQLRRMLRADKNKDFRDQIYHLMAESYMQEGDQEEAITHYRHALAQSGTNRHQQTQTYLSLASLYFSEKDYDQARHYYDSAATTLPPDFRNVDEVRRELLQLDVIIGNLQAVKQQQELQYLAALSPVLREQAIDSLIIEEYAGMVEKAKSLEEQTAQPAGATASFMPHQSPFDQGYGTENMNAFADNRFYFNNPDAVGMGTSAFRRQWGNRPLQDYWRYGTLSSGAAALGASDVMAADFPDRDADAADMTLTDLDAMSDVAIPDSMAFADMFRAAIESTLPVNDSLKLVSHRIITQALEQNGEIYRFTLRDYPSSIGSYEALSHSYPEHEHAARWLYHLYQLHQAQNEPALAARYRDQILAAFAESVYAHILLDPDYFQKLEADKRRADMHYAEVYTLYTEGKHQEVLRSIDQEAALSGTDAQLQYLRALAIGRTAAYPEFEAALNQLVDRYPSDSLVTPLVTQQLQFLAANREEFAGRDTALLSGTGMSQRFLEEPRMTSWPQLRMQTGPVVIRATPGFQAESALVGVRGMAERPVQVPAGQLAGSPELARTAEQTTFRDLSILPDTATYYFVIHVTHPTVNLSPSRFGIGQFNRTRYAAADISHQLKTVNEESQLIYVGPFATYQEARVYEGRFLPMIGDIMRIPSDVYQTFVITETVFGTLSDFGKIDDYYHFYNQP